MTVGSVKEIPNRTTKEQVARRSSAAASSGGSSQGSGFEGAADGVEDLVEVVGGLLHTQFRPKRLHDLLAVEAVPRS